MKVEFLVPDFGGNMDSVKIVLDSGVDVFAHNIETVPSLYQKARAGGDYQCSLNLLKLAKQTYRDTPTKSSIMLGLGETDAEVEQGEVMRCRAAAQGGRVLAAELRAHVLLEAVDEPGAAR